MGTADESGQPRWPKVLDVIQHLVLLAQPRCESNEPDLDLRGRIAVLVEQISIPGRPSPKKKCKFPQSTKRVRESDRLWPANDRDRWN